MKTIVITPEVAVPDEVLLCNLLFDNGLEILHLRKPKDSFEQHEAFIRGISPRYRNRIVLHRYYELANTYGLKGIHIKPGQEAELRKYGKMDHISVSCHSTEKIKALPFRPDYCFLSPVFDSISKTGYQAAFNGFPDLGGIDVPVVALGGITPERATACLRAGFTGVAVLGYIWKKPEEAVTRFIRLKTPTVMSIAGFDPSSGAGVTADIKTFENCGSYGLGINSALTFQNEDEYEGTRWIDFEEIQKQYRAVFRKHQPEFVKIGLIESFNQLLAVIDDLHFSDPLIKIIWDPILKTSSGFEFHKNTDLLKEILQKTHLITPNTNELHKLFGDTCTPETLLQLCREYEFNLLWKGGHNTDAVSCDRLLTPEGEFSFSVERDGYEKHGTGCVLSAAITAKLAQGIPLPQACAEAQVYVSAFMKSNESKLGYHNIRPLATPLTFQPSELHLQYITDHRQDLSIAEQAEAVCKGGIRWIQLRMKEAGNKEILRTGSLVQAVCRRHGALFILNDSVDLARQLDADGVHLGQGDIKPEKARRILGRGKIIGLTCNTYADIEKAALSGCVDYIGLGPYAYTTTKKKLSPVLGLQGYTEILRKMRENGIRLPVFAIGGITENDIPPLMQTGIQGIALSGVIKNSPDMQEQTQKISKIVKGESY